MRAVREGDAPRLRELRLRALADSPDAFAGTVEQESLFPAAHWEELVAQSRLGDHLAICVAVAEDRWMGMAAGRWFDRDRGIAQLWGMWVDPAVRHGGVGERLVGCVHGWASEHGARFLRLGVATRDGDATGFYERLGFVRTGEVKTFRTDRERPAHFLMRPV